MRSSFDHRYVRHIFDLEPALAHRRSILLRTLLNSTHTRGSPTLFPCEPVPGSFLTGEMLLNTTLWFLPKRSVVVRTPSAHPRTVSILLFLSALHDLCHPGRRS